VRSDGERNGEFTELADSATKWAAGPEGSRAPPEKKILRALTDNLRLIFFFCSNTTSRLASASACLRDAQQASHEREGEAARARVWPSEGRNVGAKVFARARGEGSPCRPSQG